MWTQSALAVILAIGTVSCFPQSRVVNGTGSDIEAYPFMVSIRSWTGSHSCGGTIIGSRWILTAAHCVLGKDPLDLSVQYGVTTIKSDGPTIATVKRIVIHDRFVYYTPLPNDIALLELEDELVFNYETVAPVILPEPYYETPQVSKGAPGTLIGWGYEKTGGEIQEQLQEVDLKIYSDNECHSRHKKTTNHQLCGGVDEGGKGQCSGDSGGPLLYQGSMQLGIVSWSVKPCARYKFPGVYTKVSHYVEWIRDQIN